jgi:hypothetical protein
MKFFRRVLKSAGFWILIVFFFLSLFILAFESPWPAVVQAMYSISE